jgi:Domain of unknown function (DUF5658)
MSRMLPSFVFASLLVAAAPVAAQETNGAITSAALFPVTPISTSIVAPARTAAAVEEATSTPTFVRASLGAELPSGRPVLLPALYVSQAALQVMDATSTFKALDLGGREANPLMQGVVKNRTAMMAVKAGVAASTIWMSEKMWRRGNRVGAIVTMVAANAVTAAVVAHNYQVVRQLQ